MAERFLKLLGGYIKIAVKGEQKERFLNLCKNRGIILDKLVCTDDEEMTAYILLRDFYKLRTIRNKTKVHIRILNKQGMPFFFYRNKKRKAFFLGIILCMCLLAFFSSRIWNIHVEGNVKNTTPEILEFLESEGIVHGMSKSSVSCTGTASMLRKKYPDIAWVSARIEGTRLILTIQEGTQGTEIKEASEPCNLVAEAEGEIVSMITRQGIPLVQVGDTCKAGDMLVSGELHIMNDSQEIVRYEYVHADADVYVSHSLSYYHEFPLKYEKQTGTGNIKKGFYLKIGKLYLGFHGSKKSGWRRTVTEYPWKITENMYLPAAFGTVLFKKYETGSFLYTKEQAKTLAQRRLWRYEEKLLQKGVQISENNVKIEISNTACTARGTLQVIEKTGRETPVVKQEQPTERTAKDDQQHN